jgi:programmed cell death protein 4
MYQFFHLILYCASIEIKNHVKSMVGCFLARAVVDEVLPPAYLSNQNNDRPGDPVIEKAVSLLSREHCTARLERVWGPGDGRPVAELKAVLDQLLTEFLMSRELDEAARCVRELNAPHFHHELIKRGVTHAMESSDPKDSLDAMAVLFAFLVENSILSEYQVAKGIDRLKKLLPDMILDIPLAPVLLSDFETMVHTMGCLPDSEDINSHHKDVPLGKEVEEDSISKVDVEENTG